MINYFSISDIRQLHKFALFSKSHPVSISLFRSTLSLFVRTDTQQFELFEVRKLMAEASTQADSWSARVRSFSRLHSDIQQFTDEFVLRSEHLLSATSMPIDSSSLADFAASKIGPLQKECNVQRQEMARLATGIYSVLPRLTDYLHSNVYLFAERQNMISSGRPIKLGNRAQRISITINPAPNPILAYRFGQTLKFIDNYEREYALSYAAASNIVGHFTRVEELAADCMRKTLDLKNAKRRLPIESRIGTLLISLKELQRISGAASELFRRW